MHQFTISYFPSAVPAVYLGNMFCSADDEKGSKSLQGTIIADRFLLLMQLHPRHATRENTTTTNNITLLSL